MNKDSSGNIFDEIPMEDGSIRLTFIQDGWNNSPSITIQIKDDSSKIKY